MAMWSRMVAKDHMSDAGLPGQVLLVVLVLLLARSALVLLVRSVLVLVMYAEVLDTSVQERYSGDLRLGMC